METPARPIRLGSGGVSWLAGMRWARAAQGVVHGGGVGRGVCVAHRSSLPAPRSACTLILAWIRPDAWKGFEWLTHLVTARRFSRRPRPWLRRWSGPGYTPCLLRSGMSRGCISGGGVTTARSWTRRLSARECARPLPCWRAGRWAPRGWRLWRWNWSTMPACFTTMSSTRIRCAAAARALGGQGCSGGDPRGRRLVLRRRADHGRGAGRGPDGAGAAGRRAGADRRSPEAHRGGRP